MWDSQVEQRVFVIEVYNASDNARVKIPATGSSRNFGNVGLSNSGRLAVTGTDKICLTGHEGNTIRWERIDEGTTREVFNWLVINRDSFSVE